MWIEFYSSQQLLLQQLSEQSSQLLYAQYPLCHFYDNNTPNNYVNNYDNYTNNYGSGVLASAGVVKREKVAIYRTLPAVKLTLWLRATPMVWPVAAMSSPVIKASPTEDAGKLKSMVVILREENQVESCYNSFYKLHFLSSTVRNAPILSTCSNCRAGLLRSCDDQLFCCCPSLCVWPCHTTWIVKTAIAIIALKPY